MYVFAVREYFLTVGTYCGNKSRNAEMECNFDILARPQVPTVGFGDRGSCQRITMILVYYYNGRSKILLIEDFDKLRLDKLAFKK
jgi:hypothetical protein